MQVLIQVLLVIGLVLGVITVVGHGLSVLLAAILRRTRRPTTGRNVLVCVFCGSNDIPRRGRAAADTEEICAADAATECATCKQSDRQLQRWGDLGGCRETVRNCAARAT